MATTAAQDRVRKPLAFEILDARGNTVVCARSTWDGHIAKEHPEMANRLVQVIAAIEDPDGIRESTARGGAQVFERIGLDSVQIRVVATFDEPHSTDSGRTTGKVNTAFPVQSDQYDRPHVGRYVYTRPLAPIGR